MPISSATNTARRGSARLKTKPPVGPLNCTGSPTLSARSHCEPIPPGATSTESVIDRLRAGVERMVQARTALGPKGTEIHLDDLGARPANGRHFRAARPRLLRQLSTLTPAFSLGGRGRLSAG